MSSIASVSLSTASPTPYSLASAWAPACALACFSASSASSKPSNNSRCPAGSAKASAAFLFTLLKSSFHNAMISDTRLGAYVRAMNAASGIRFVSINKSMQPSISFSMNIDTNATLFLPLSFDSSTSCLSVSGDPDEVASNN